MTTLSSLINDIGFLSVGFRFSPTDEELVNTYLKNKLLDNDSIVNNVIAEVDICKFEPWDLPARSLIKSDDPEWLFFCPRNYKYVKSKKSNRATKFGFWKATGNDQSIKTIDTDQVIGTKKILDKWGIHDWVIHEYHDAVTFHDDAQRTFVLCRLMKKAEIKDEEENDTIICDEGGPSRRMTISFPPGLDFVPLGLRFCPTCEELINYYLRNKLLGNDAIVNKVIAEVDVRKFEPWELPACSVTVIKSDEPEWFFLCPLVYKYAKSKRIDRTTKNGFWKATGKDRSIKIRGTNNVIGTKKTLVYHKGSVPAVKSDKTNWIIHEYHDATFDDSQRTFVLCRLMKKTEKKTEEEAGMMICDEGESSRHMSFDYENQETVQGVSNVISGTLPEINMESTFEEPYQADKYFLLSTQQSSIYENENIVIDNPFATIEEENKFINSMLVDGDFVTSENSRQL